MRLTKKLALIATMATACIVQSCAKPTGSLIETDINTAVLMRKAGGWVLSSTQPNYPDNSAPLLQTMYGAGAEAPFGCGLTEVRNGYFSGPRGDLACLIRLADGRLHLRGIQRGARFSRVYDAVPVQDGFLVMVQPHGDSAATAIILDPDGEVQGNYTLPGRVPDTAVILSSDRVALLRSEGPSCNWTILERNKVEFREVALVPADRPLCHLSNYDGEALRDQTSGQAYLLSRYPTANALYRIDDNGVRSPATLVAANLGSDVDPESHSAATHIMINNGGVYFNYPTQAGAFIGRYDLKTGATTRTDFRAPSGRWHDADRVYGIAIGRLFGSSPHVALMNRAGARRVTALNH